MYYPYLFSSYFRLKYKVIESIHSNGNKEHKANPKSQFLFGDITEELKIELKELGYEVIIKQNKIKLK